MRLFVEEINLIALYHAGNRVNTMVEIRRMMGIGHEPETVLLMQDCINKLEQMDDAEFERTDFFLFSPVVGDSY